MTWYRLKVKSPLAGVSAVFIREELIMRIYPEDNWLVMSDGTNLKIMDDGIDKILSDIKGNVKDFTKADYRESEDE